MLRAHRNTLGKIEANCSLNQRSGCQIHEVEHLGNFPCFSEATEGCDSVLRPLPTQVSQLLVFGAFLVLHVLISEGVQS